VYLVTHFVTFGESPGATSKARFRRHSGATSRKRNAAGGPWLLAQRGATQFVRRRVAILGKVTDIPGEPRRSAAPLAADELRGSEYYKMSDEVH
jgi:hypothetical protein